MPGPLAGVRVIDWTMMGVGPFTGAVLGALGADVVKIEPPEGDYMHAQKPTIDGVGGSYLACNTSKRSIRVDVRSERGRVAVGRLVDRADVLVTNLRLGVLDRLGFGYEAVRARNPEIVYLQATGFGDVGPMGYATGGDHWNQVFSGWCSIMGAEGGAPELLRCLGHIDFNTSLYNVGAVLTALVARERRGGAKVDTSMHQAALAVQTTRLAEYLIGGVTPGPLGSAAAVVAPSQAFQCQGGEYLYLSADTQRQWQRLCAAIGRADLGARAEYATNADRVRSRRALAAELGATLAEHPVAWWLRILGRARVPSARFWDFDTLIGHPQVLANEHIVPLDPARCGDAVTGGVPWKFRGAPARVGPPTFSGTETEAIYAEADAPAPPREPRAREAVDGPALEALRFLDLTSGIAGPYCGSLLADGGAEVTKVELPEGDHLRTWGPPFVDGSGAAYLHLNRRKRMRSINWRTPEGLRELRSLAAAFDGVILDAVDADGEPPPLSPEEIRAANPRAIVVSTSPYGEEGPLAGLPGSELTVQAMSEALAGLGRVGEPPARIGADQASLVGGLVAYHGMLASLWRRQRTGEGDQVSTSALGGLLTLRSYFLGSMSVAREWSGLWATYSDPPSLGTPTADRAVLYTLNTRISKAADREETLSLLAALGTALPDGMDPGAENGTPGHPAHARWNDFWRALFATRGWAELAEIFEKHGGQVVPLMDWAGLDAHAQTLALRPFVEETIAGRAVRTVPPPWRIVRRPGAAPSEPPAVSVARS